MTKNGLNEEEVGQSKELVSYFNSLWYNRNIPLKKQLVKWENFKLFLAPNKRANNFSQQTGFISIF